MDFETMAFCLNSIKFFQNNFTLVDYMHVSVLP
jgi:hypothetical protein